MLGDVRGILGWIKLNQHGVIVVTNNLSCNASSPDRDSAHGKRTATYLDLTPISQGDTAGTKQADQPNPASAIQKNVDHHAARTCLISKG